MSDLVQRPYEVTWQSKHVETVWAHHVNLPSADGAASGAFTFMGEVDGQIRLMLAANPADIVSIRPLPIEPA